MPDHKISARRSRALQFSLNEFGAQKKIRHQPLAEASGMSDFRTHFCRSVSRK